MSAEYKPSDDEEWERMKTSSNVQAAWERMKTRTSGQVHWTVAEPEIKAPGYAMTAPEQIAFIRNAIEHVLRNYATLQLRLEDVPSYSYNVARELLRYRGYRLAAGIWSRAGARFTVADSTLQAASGEARAVLVGKLR